MTDTAVQPAAAVDQWLASFDEALTAGDTAAAAAAVPRGQLLARPRRVHLEHQDRRGAATACEDMLGDDARAARSRATGARPSRRTRPTASTTAWIEFETEAGRGNGLLRLQGRQGVDAADRALRAQGPRGAEGPGPAARASSTAPTKGRETWLEARQREAEELGYETQPEVVIVGGGQGGIALGARLRQLGVPTIIVERNERPGDSWRKRYKSLCLHDPVWYDHLPYIKFPENWPVFSPKDKIGDWLEMYTRVMELNYWSSHDGQERHATTRTPASGRSSSSATAPTITLRPKQLVLATGMSGKPNVPRDPGHGRLQGRPAPLLAAPRARTPTRARRPS